MPAPTIQVSSPSDGLIVTNNSVAVQGTASDGAGIAMVQCQVEGGNWSPAQGTSNWSFQASLTLGKNVIEAYAEDNAGNFSTTDTVNVIYVPRTGSGILQLMANGLGSITGDFKDNILQVGTNYTVRAVAGPGQVFAGWTGDIESDQNPLTFTMQPTLILQANFEVNPFVALKGVYNGLFYSTNVIAPTNSGAFTITLTDRGGYTGKLWLGGRALTLLGSFNAQGMAQQTVKRSNQNSVVVNLQLDLIGGQQVSGTVQATGWGADLFGYRAKSDATTNPTPVGNYTMVVEGCTNPAVAPAGYSIGTVAVAASGQVTFTETLADGTRVPLISSSLSSDGLWPFYVSLYRGKGLLIGWVGLTNQTLVGMDLDWVKEAGAGGKYYPDGFAFETGVKGCKYVAPAGDKPLLNWSNGVVTLQDGDLTTILTNNITVTSKNRLRVTGTNTDMLTLTLTPSTGLFKGSFHPPGATKPVVFNAVVLTDLGWAGGFFLGTNQSGSVSIGKE